MSTLLPDCLCGGEGQESKINGLDVICCRSCGIVRQSVAMTPEQYAAWYGVNYIGGAYTHTYEHDRAVAVKRLLAYGLEPGARILDIGCGNGAFVDEALHQGLDAWGQDLAEASLSDRVYVGDLLDIGFPTEDFDVVTIHDVLEHVIDPVGFLKEVRRILKGGGTLIVDFPRFNHPAGVHHWKPVEHLWLLGEDQLESMLKDAGLELVETTHPIESKVVVRCINPAVERVKILVPAGIGDALWSLTKIPGYMREIGRGDEIPSIVVQDSGGPKRTHPFIRCIPSVHAGGYHPAPLTSAIWNEAYMQDGRTTYPGAFGADVFIAYNGVMRFGKALEDVDVERGTEWYPRIFISKEAARYRDQLREKGPYAFCYFTDSGMYKNWLAQFGPKKIADSLTLMQSKLGLRPVLIGAEWDQGKTGDQLAPLLKNAENLVGDTSFDQMLGALLGASLVYGFPAGNTILGTVLDVPTLLLWNKYFVEPFWGNVAPPDALYTTMDTAGLTPESVLVEMEFLLSEGE